VSISLSAVDDLIARYGAAEQAGRAKVPNLAIQAFSLEVFQAIGYPHRISSSRELWRYHDVMQDGRLEQNLGLLGSAMDGEVDLVQRAADAIVDFSFSVFGFASAGKDMLSRAVYQYSLLASVLDGVPRPWTILEVGPGCGYLGVLLGLAGHRYIALEASQAFWVHQSALLQHVFGEEYSDGLVEDRRRISHLAWWDFCSEGSTLPQLTACTANHMLGEMNPSGLIHLTRKLYGSQTDGFQLLAEDLGLCRYTGEQETLKRIVKSDFNAEEIRGRVWLFTKTRDAAFIHRIPAKRPSLRNRIYEVRFVGPVLRTTYRLLLGTILGRLRHVLASRVVDQRAEDKTKLGRVADVFAHLPDYQSPDGRFMSGNW
jgi:hypothetical protein